MAHPYYPPTLSLPHYAPPSHAVSTLLLGMALLSAAALALAWHVMTRLNPTLSRRAKAAAAWFLFSGLLHVHFEGYYVKHRATLAARRDFAADLWKEYAKSDSRYLARDSFVVAIEGLTVIFLGPLCLLTFLAIVLGSRKQHPARLLACCCHLYGCALYFVTATLDGNRHCRPEPLYFWGYYVACNLPWIVVPALLGWRSVKAIEREFEGRGRRIARGSKRKA
ncbi:Emopamil-binding protein [Sphaerosporella brunnea]|uniref:Emopamil-binding protein n=1 Tax=Sphaerosporella brunnea TaxID=1250544 RepID=A0A5J5EKY1_9PEZI|nr:Emopamil-binding protein [Sphaerosporella brunnea]